MWDTAGDVWGQTVKQLVPRSRVTVKSANDIEAFRISEWTACGYGVELWYDGYQRETVISNFNFGDNAWADNNVLWSEDQIYQATFGRITAFVFPEVYCTGSFWDRSWIPVKRDHPNMYFNGVTSTNGGTGPPGCNVPSLYAQPAWNRLNNAITVSHPPDYPTYPGYSDSVLPNILVWWQSPQ